MPPADKSQRPRGGERLKRWRLGRQLTQQQLAEYLGVSRVAIWYWETGRVGIQHERMLSLALRHYDCVNAAQRQPA